MKNKRLRFPVIILLAGVLLIAAVVIYFSVNAIESAKARKQNEQILDRINTFIPEPHQGIVEEGRDNFMPVLSIDGTDYIGIITVPAYNTELPVASVWNEKNSKRLITRYFGTLQEGNLVLGADNAYGLFDFSKEITKDDRIFFTDMEGIIYSYVVEDVIHTRNISEENLTYDGLTIFIRSKASSNCIVVYCR